MESNLPDQIDIHYQKSTDYKTITSTGVFGGVTSAAQVDLNFFVDRVVIPTKMAHRLELVDGNAYTLGEVVSSEGKTGSIREVQVGILLDLHIAIGVRDWLNDKISQLQAQR
ncbi:hypothetical protein [Siphonobacter curvatus]|uniref:Uncharacterized protein n=1 Tax=Siphonobacter curvatus TaxID=2094562 RepID=A0A2S7IR41_9BACT|nr:hypothetical protein [Siphonobacter curvatus]PQA60174.1 hypothetical protein C5O19_11305 [Siphonobacter curvatus]